MAKRTRQEAFIDRMKEIFGDEYDFSDSVYLGANKYITYKCKRHGLVTTKASNLLKGFHCKKCANQAKRSLICNWGVNDYDGIVNVNGEHIPSYKRWYGMISRCYGNNKSKVSCSICDEWKSFSRFKEWFDDKANGFKEGYHLNKELLMRGNTVYSPQLCCFLPAEINTAIVGEKSHNGIYKSGVSFDKIRNVYKSRIRLDDKKSLFLGYFTTEEDAFIAYKAEKEKHLHKLAEKYFSQGLIDKRIYDALYKYELEEND